MSVQSTIEATIDSMSPSLARIAQVIRENPTIVLEATIAELAEAAATSVASVVRFCNAIGFAGYAPLRMALATELGKESVRFAGQSGFGADIARADSLRDMATKLARLETLAIEETIAGLDFTELERVVEAIDRSSRILLYGVGASYFVAEDLGHKLLRIGRNAVVLSDTHEAVATASLPIPGTVAVCFSHRGETPESMRYITVAGESRALTVGLTSVKDSPLAAAVDHVLFTRARETAFRAGAMVSRIAQMAVVDCIFVGVAQRRYDETVDALRRTREATRRLLSD
ncbi:MAG: MurR/RpiR family transcriptional regulator [Beutenbergiaceae bacterium]